MRLKKKRAAFWKLNFEELRNLLR